MKKAILILMCMAAMMMAGTSLKAQEITIVLNPGWTWISCPSTDTLDFTTAFGSFTPAIGDIIKSKWGAATYTADGQWRGSVSLFYPGYGYHYKSNRTEPVIVTFNAQQPAPQVVVTTSEPTDITAASAIVGGTVTLDESNHIYACGVCWDTVQMPTVNGNHTSNDANVGTFTDTLTELSPNTIYYLRAYVVTDYGLAYGEEMNFITLASNNDHEYVDLGLPSGTLWATCNVGANTPEEYGDYFAWGETQPKNMYNWSTYQYCNGSWNSLTKYCNFSGYGYNGFTDNLTTLEPSDDAATANWGGDWRMPTRSELVELYQNTTSTWGAQNGVYGSLLTAPNGNSIFLPNTGYYYGNCIGGNGRYWSSSLSLGDPTSASYFNLDDDGGMDSDSRYYGGSVRAVRSGSQNNAPTGAINGKFSINSNADQVYFSQGNLQYQASTNTWRFAENQWDYVGTQTPDFDGYFGGTVNSSDNCDISYNYNGWIDLFGWGTSGYHDSIDLYNVNYQPWSAFLDDSIVNSDYNFYGYGPSTNMASPNLTGSSANYDWGVYNPISNGGNQTNQWRTLTQSEWAYVFNTRNTASGIRYVKATVNGVKGIILLPDDWTTSIYTLNHAIYHNFDNNIINVADWSCLFEANGAIFLPNGGYRQKTSVYSVGAVGNYWSATYEDKYDAYGVFFGDYYFNTINEDRNRCRGRNIRLVKDIE